METRKKKKTFNIIMVALIAVIVFCGIMAAGMTKGWFGGNSDSAVTSGKVTGVVNIERNGVAYALDKKISMESGDLVETKKGSVAEFKVLGSSMAAISELSEMTFESCEKDNISMGLNAGELFADITETPAAMQITFGGNAANVTESVFSVTAQAGSHSISVYNGHIDVTVSDGNVVTVSSGEMLNIVQQTGGNLDVEKTDMKAETVSDFMIEKLQACSRDELCFTQDELKTVAEERAKESAAAEDADGDLISADGSKADKKDASAKKEDVNTCTIQIRCETILKNMDNLTAGKERFVPSNGIILATSTVEFNDGETVFDVLKRVCSYAGIQLEYSYTPMYESYYIEGINNLYEFDCGPESGWMYKVNGWFPNYGCSAYELKDGDNIVWTYTCNGLGADVGGYMR